MANSIGQIALDLVVNPSKFRKQMKGITGMAKGQTAGLIGMFGKVGAAIGVAFSVSAVVNFSKACLQLGSDLAEVQNVVDVTFGSMSGKVNDFAKKSMTSFGLSEKVAKDYMGQFGAMSKAFGNSTDTAYNQAEKLTGLVGDVASFYNLSTDEAFTKLKAVFTGETESLKSLGVVMTQAALDEFALAKGYGKTTSAMTEQEKVALRLAFVTDRLSGASGDFVRTADGWANQTRVLALRFDAIKASIGQGLINALLPVVRVLNTILERLQVVADAFSDFMANLFGNAGSTSSAINAAATGSGIIASNLDDAETSAMAVKKALAGFDQLNIISSKSGGSSNAGTDMGGSTIGGTESIEPEISAGAAAVGKLKGFLQEVKNTLIEIANITGLKGLWDDFLISVDNVKIGLLDLFGILKSSVANVMPNLEELKNNFINAFLSIFHAVTTTLGDIFVSLSNGFKSFLEENRASLETACTNYLSIVTNLWSLISGSVYEIFASIKAWWEADGKRIFDEIVQVIKDIGAWIVDLWNNWISPVLETAVSALSDLWNNHLKPLWDETLAFITSVWDNLKALYDNILKPIIDWVVKNLGPVFTSLMNGITKTVKTAIATITDVIKGIIKTFRGILDFITGVFTGDWKKAWEGIKTAFSGVCDTFKSLWKGTGKIFDDVWNTIKEAAPRAWAAIKNAFTSVKSWFNEKVTNPIKNAFGNAFDSLKTKATDAWTKVKNVFSSGGKIFDGIKDGIADAFKKIVNKLIDGINRVISKPFNAINDVLDKIRKFSVLGTKPFSSLGSISVPQIPKLATGGYVAANTPQLAIIGDNKREGEIVAPESKITEAVVAAFRQFLPLFNNSGNNKPIYLTLKLGDGTFWEGFVDYHNDIVKRTGDTPLLI